MFQFELPDVLFQLPLKTPQFQPLLALQPNKSQEQATDEAQIAAPIFIMGDTFPLKPLYRSFLRTGRAATAQCE